MSEPAPTPAERSTMQATTYAPRPSVARRFIRDPRAMTGAAFIALFTAFALFAPWIAPYDPIEIRILEALSAPSPAHLLGTDELGRDILSRIIYGARVSLSVGFIAVGVAATIGGTLGLIAGFVGGRTDSVIMRLMDVILAFPAILLALAISAALGASVFNVMLAIGFVYIPRFARLVRGQMLSLRESDYATAAKALGQVPVLIMVRHLLPNALSVIIVQASIAMGWAILSEAALSFLGVGVSPPMPTWGSMLSMGRGYMEVAPWLTMFPGIAIFLTVLGFNLMGDGVRDVLDPTMRS